MKSIKILFAVMILLNVASCNYSGKEKPKVKEGTALQKTACDEFLEKYEEWADEYFEALEEYAKNPSDEEVIIHFTELIQQTMEWSTKWADLVECADDEEYEKRFKEISQEIDKKLEELNL